MISSTRADLQEYRNEASKIIKRFADEKEKSIHLREISMEREGQTGEREWSVDSSKRWVEESDWIVVIVGFHYGSVSDHSDAEGLSMTEWEYRHAIAKGGKKVFVFMADDPPGAVQRSAIDHGLKRWLHSGSNEKMLQFRQALQARHLQTFSNLAGFRKDLQTTLRSHIEELTKSPSGALADLVAAVGDAIKAFTDEVELIADCKAIHDGLHELLQRIIRPLHDGVLPKWKDDGDLKPETLREFIKLVVKLAKQEGLLESRMEKLDANGGKNKSDLYRFVSRVLRCAGLLHPDGEPESERSRFAELFDDLADAIDTAFREADIRMQREAGVLRTRRHQLLKRVENVRQQRPLSPSEDYQIGAWLHETGEMLEKLCASLYTHHDWQEIHEAIERVEALRDTSRFRSKLTGFCEDNVHKLKDMVKSELELICARGQWADRIGAAHLRTLQAGLTRLDKSKLEEDFDAIRTPFDDSFYNVDKRTLIEVEESRHRVQNWSKFRDELLRAHSLQSASTISAGRLA
jgi:hypothetical protein